MSSERAAPSKATLRRQLGKEGLFRFGVPRSFCGHGGTKEDVVRAVAAVAKRHPKSVVLLASQRLLIEVLLQAENVGVMEYPLPDQLEGHLGGNCAASWPGKSAVSLADARDTGRGWRMSGRFPALPNLDRDWFLVAVPVVLGTGTPHLMALLECEEDGIVQRDEASHGFSGTAFELRNILLGEHEILFSDGKCAVERLTVMYESMKAALIVARAALRELLVSLQGASASVPSTVMAVA